MLRKEYSSYKKTSEKTISKLEKEKASLEKQLEDALASLKKQQEKVVHPLIEQFKKTQGVIEKLTEDKVRINRSLKMFHAIIRSPKLCDLYHRTEAKKVNEERREQAKNDAFLLLRQEKVNENSKPFIENLISEVHHFLREQ